MNTDYTNINRHWKEALENEEVALKFLEQKEYFYIFNKLDDKYKNNKIFLLKAIEKNKWILPLTYIFNENELKILFEKYFEDVNIKDEYGNTALILVSCRGYTKIVELILQNENINVNIQNENKYTALILASYGGYTEIVELLLQNENIDVNIQNKYKDTALIWASVRGYTEIVKLLLQNENIDVNIQNEYGYTAFFWASARGYTEIVELLESHHN